MHVAWSRGNVTEGGLWEVLTDLGEFVFGSGDRYLRLLAHAPRELARMLREAHPEERG